MDILSDECVKSGGPLSQDIGGLSLFQFDYPTALGRRLDLKDQSGWDFPMRYAIALRVVLSLAGCGLRSQRLAEQRNAEDDAKCISYGAQRQGPCRATRLFTALAQRFVQPAERPKRDAQVVVSSGIARIDSKGLLETSDRLFGPAEHLPTCDG
jgi:hypothetical protein